MLNKIGLLILLLHCSNAFSGDSIFRGDGFYVDNSQVGEATIDRRSSERFDITFYSFGDPKSGVLVHVTNYKIPLSKDISQHLIEEFRSKSKRNTGIKVFVDKVINSQGYSGLQYVSGNMSNQYEFRMFHVGTLEIRFMAPILINGVKNKENIDFLESIKLVDES